MTITPKQKNQWNIKRDFADTTKTASSKKLRSPSPVTLRLTPEERLQLEELADGMTLSAYIRACIFEQESKRRRKKRSNGIIADKKLMAEVLGLLGHSRIANNLNQLAYQANIGALVMEEEEKTQINECYALIQDMRGLLVEALNSGAK